MKGATFPTVLTSFSRRFNLKSVFVRISLLERKAIKQFWILLIERPILKALFVIADLLILVCGSFVR